ncbi:hypothetical protein ACQ4LE_005258 [Meloidogyne hapla]
MLTPNDSVFNYYNSSGTLYILTAKYGSVALLSVVAFLFNSFNVYTTWKNKCFHHRCNIYIALNSFFSLPLHFGMSVKFFILLSGINFISLNSCYYIQAIPLLSTSIASQIEFNIGVDRLLSTAFPIWYKFNDHYKSVVILSILNICRVARTNWLFLKMALTYPDKPTMCAAGDLILPETNSETHLTANIYNLMTVACYTMIWILIIIRNDSNPNNKRLMKSLTTIILINLSGNVNTEIWLLILPSLSFTAINIDSFVVVPALLMFVVSYGSNMPVLYIFSKEYNHAFKNTFQHLFSGKQLTTQIMTTSMLNRSNNARNLNRGNISRMNNIPIEYPVRQF